MFSKINFSIKSKARYYPAFETNNGVGLNPLKIANILMESSQIISRAVSVNNPALS